MELDVESRLRHYGPVLDDAADLRVDRAVVALSPSRRWPATALVLAAVATLTVGAGVMLAGRASGPDATSTAPPAGETLPVVLAPGIVPWYVVDPGAVAGFEPGLGSEEFRLDGGWQTAACTDWVAAGDAVQCRVLEIDGFRPSQTLRDVQGRWVSISTLHRADYNAAQYSSDWTYQAEYEHLGVGSVYVSGETVDVDGVEATYTSTDDSDPNDPSSTRRVTFAAGPSTFVAIETHGFSRDELLAFASSTDPVDPATVPSIPLLLAAANTTPQPGQRRDGLLGGVIGGEVCAYPLDHIVSDVSDPCEPLAPDTPMQILIADPHWQPGLYLGLTSGEVHTLRVDFADGTSLSVTPREQPVWSTRAFAFFYPDARAVRISALDAAGSELAGEDIEDDTPVVTSAATDG